MNERASLLCHYSWASCVTPTDCPSGVTPVGLQGPAVLPFLPAAPSQQVLCLSGPSSSVFLVNCCFCSTVLWGTLPEHQPTRFSFQPSPSWRFAGKHTDTQAPDKQLPRLPAALGVCPPAVGLALRRSGAGVSLCGPWKWIWWLGGGDSRIWHPGRGLKGSRVLRVGTCLGPMDFWPQGEGNGPGDGGLRQ